MRAQEHGALALTDAQLGIWFAAALDPGSGYECAEVLELDGPVDVDRLVRAADAAIAEVGALRVRFDVVDGLPVQRVRPVHESPRTRVLDLRDDPDDGAARAWMDEQIRTPRPLTGEELVDSVVLRLRERDAWFLRIHHVLADAYAFGLLEHRAARLYADDAPRAATEGMPTAAPEASIVAAAGADAAHRASDRHAADVAHWNSVLADAPAPARLTRAAPPDGRRTASGDVDAAASGRLRERVEAAGASWPAVVTALFADHVGATTGTTDVLLGLPMTGRTAADLTRIGTCVNVVPLRVRVDPTATVGTLTADVADALRGARTHQRTRSEHVARAVDPAQAVPAWTTAARINLKPFSTTVRFGERRARVVPLATGPVEDVELTVSVDDVTGALHLVLDANAATCTQGEVDAHHARLLHRLEVLAEQDEPLDLPLADLPVATPDDRARLAGWNATQHPVPATTLTDLVRVALDRPPVPGESPALVWDGGTTSREELRTRSRTLADVLVDRGVGPGDVVAVAAPRGPELMVALAAVLDAGAAYLPLDLDAPPARIAEVVALAEPVLVVTTQDVLDSDLGAALPAEHLVLTSDVGRRHDRRSPAASDPAYVIFTSGSTGAPKGVVVPHAGIVNRLLWMQDAARLADGDAVLQKTPVTFDVSVWELFLPLVTGVPLVLLAPGAHRDPAAICTAVVEHGVSTLHFVPSMLRELRDHLLVSPAERAGLAARVRTVVCSGEALDATTVDDVRAMLPSTRVLNLYGPTEASVDVTAWDCGQDTPTADPVPIGEPVWNTRLAVLDAAGRELPPGAVGELHLAGVQLATGYRGRPDLTAERFVVRPAGIAGTTEPTRWYRTGDTATWGARPDGRGVVTYLGRGDRQVKIRGQRIELGEIEARVAGHTDVASAAVLAMPDLVGDLELVAAVVAHPHARGSLAGLVHDLRATLPGAMVPRVVEVDALPTTRHGKLDTAGLVAAAQEARTSVERDVDGAWAAVPDAHAGTVRALLAQVLGHDDLHPDDAFFAVGGDSLKAARLVAALRDVGPRRPTIADVFAATSLADLVRAVGGASDEAQATDVLLTLRRGGRELVACVHPAGGLSWCYAPMLRSLPADVALVGLQSPAYAGGKPARSIGELAQRYADVLAEVADGRPVHLVGWSVGGVVAHDLAVRAADRFDVASLTLLDAYPSAAWRSLPAPDDVDAARALAVMGGLDGDVAEHGGPGGRALTTREVLDRLRAADSPMAQLPEPVLERLPAVVGGHVRALREHSEQVHRGDLTLVRATRTAGPGAAQDASWSPWTCGTVREVAFDGAHVDLVSARGLELVASLLPIGERRPVRA